MSTEIEGLRLKSSRLFRCLFAVVLDTLMDRMRCMATEIGLVLGRKLPGAYQNTFHSPSLEVGYLHSSSSLSYSTGFLYKKQFLDTPVYRRTSKKLPVFLVSFHVALVSGLETWMCPAQARLFTIQ